MKFSYSKGGLPSFTQWLQSHFEVLVGLGRGSLSICKYMSIFLWMEGSGAISEL